MELIDRVRELAANQQAETVAVRRHLHQHPELSFEEHETARYVADQLRATGVDFETDVAGTGLVAYVRGRNPESKVVALRGDMDALPIQEANDVPYRSQNEGVMHACGHDVHTSALLGALRVLHGVRDAFEGTVKCVFQPGEERIPGGASLMVKAGVLENPAPETIVAQHVFPELEVGNVGFCPGHYMASCDEIYVTVKGKGGHAALPHKLVDPVLIASHLVVALQQLVSRRIDPNVPAVLSFGRIEGYGATNVIPDEVKLAGTFRTYNEEWRYKLHDLMTELAENLAKSMGGSCDFNIMVGYPYLENDPELTARTRQSAVEFLGADKVIDLNPRMTSEDFSYYSQQIPACFYRLGIANKERGITSGLHTPTFDIDEQALEIGSGLMAWIALRELGAS